MHRKLSVKPHSQRTNVITNFTRQIGDYKIAGKRMGFTPSPGGGGFQPTFREYDGAQITNWIGQGALHMYIHMY